MFNFKFNLAMKNLFFIPMLLCSILFVSCDPGFKGTGDIITVSRSETDFHALDMGGCGQVEMRTDSVYSVEISCEESILPYLETVVENGVLKIYFDRNVWDVDGLYIRVTAPNWDGINLSGSARINLQDPIAGDDLQLKLSGSGIMNIANADFTNTHIKISGSGDVFLNGQGDDIHCNVTGSGNINAREFPVKTARAVITGSGNVRLNVSEFLQVSISGSGNVEFEGDPQLSSNISGSGKVRKL